MLVCVWVVVVIFDVLFGFMCGVLVIVVECWESWLFCIVGYGGVSVFVCCVVLVGYFFRILMS